METQKKKKPKEIDHDILIRMFENLKGRICHEQVTNITLIAHFNIDDSLISDNGGSTRQITCCFDGWNTFSFSHSIYIRTVSS